MTTARATSKTSVAIINNSHKNAPLMQIILFIYMMVVPFSMFFILPILGWTGWITWLSVAMFPFWWILRGVGITGGNHRMLSHRSFEAVPPVKFGFLMGGALAAQSWFSEWVASHLKHHRFSDIPGFDPHTPHEYGPGFWNRLQGAIHAHLWWIVEGTELENEYHRPMSRDQMVIWFDKTRWFWTISGFVLPGLIEGMIVFSACIAVLAYTYGTSAWGLIGLLILLPTVAKAIVISTGIAMISGFLVNGVCGILFLLHVTWSINSLCHITGHRPFISDDESCNLPGYFPMHEWGYNPLRAVTSLIAIGHFGISCGESAHNDHHWHPESAFVGLSYRFWWLDITGDVIRILEKLKLVKNVRRVPKHVIQEGLKAKRVADAFERVRQLAEAFEEAKRFAEALQEADAAQPA